MKPALTESVAGAGDDEGNACAEEVGRRGADEGHCLAAEVEALDNSGIKVVEPGPGVLTAD